MKGFTYDEPESVTDLWRKVQDKKPLTSTECRDLLYVIGDQRAHIASLECLVDHLDPGKPYNAHIRSTKWKRIRDSRRKNSNGRCQVCGAKTWLDVHHNTYRNFGNEPPEDLTLLCRKCHNIFHRAA